jgi:hypothetical protein
MYRVLVMRAGGSGTRQWDGGLGKAYSFECVLCSLLDKGRGVWKFSWINQRENPPRKGKEKKSNRITLQRRRFPGM